MPFTVVLPATVIFGVNDIKSRKSVQEILFVGLLAV